MSSSQLTQLNSTLLTLPQMISTQLRSLNTTHSSPLNSIKLKSAHLNSHNSPHLNSPYLTQGVVKHGRGNGYGAPDLCVMQVPPAYIVFCSNSSALVFSGFHVCQFFLPNSGKNTRKRQVENDLQWFLGFFILLYVQWR